MLLKCSGPWAYKTGNISETRQGRAKVTINGLYKIMYWYELSIAAKMCDLKSAKSGPRVPSIRSARLISFNIKFGPENVPNDERLFSL